MEVNKQGKTGREERRKDRRKTMKKEKKQRKEKRKHASGSVFASAAVENDFQAAVMFDLFPASRAATLQYSLYLTAQIMLLFILFFPFSLH